MIRYKTRIKVSMKMLSKQIQQEIYNTLASKYGKELEKVADRYIRDTMLDDFDKSIFSSGTLLQSRKAEFTKFFKFLRIRHTVKKQIYQDKEGELWGKDTLYTAKAVTYGLGPNSSYGPRNFLHAAAVKTLKYIQNLDFKIK